MDVCSNHHFNDHCGSIGENEAVGSVILSADGLRHGVYDVINFVDGTSTTPSPPTTTGGPGDCTYCDPDPLCYYVRLEGYSGQPYDWMNGDYLLPQTPRAVLCTWQKTFYKTGYEYPCDFVRVRLVMDATSLRAYFEQNTIASSYGTQQIRFQRIFGAPGPWGTTTTVEKCLYTGYLDHGFTCGAHLSKTKCGVCCGVHDCTALAAQFVAGTLRCWVSPHLGPCGGITTFGPTLTTAGP